MSNYPYKRIDHLIVLLSQSGLKTDSDIPADIIGKIISEIDFNKWKKMDNIDKKMIIKVIMKKNSWQQYYEYIALIIKQLDDPENILTIGEEEQLKELFIQVSNAYNMCCPMTGFFNYSFIINKLLLMIERDDLAKSFAMSKSEEKMQRLEKKWVQICQFNGWQ